MAAAMYIVISYLLVFVYPFGKWKESQYIITQGVSQCPFQKAITF